MHVAQAQEQEQSTGVAYVAELLNTDAPQRTIAEMCGVTQQAVSVWINRKQGRIPEKYWERLYWQLYARNLDPDKERI